MSNEKDFFDLREQDPDDEDLSDLQDDQLNTEKIKKRNDEFLE